MVGFINGVISIFIIYLIVAVLWWVAEILFYGKVTPRKLDDAIAFILAISLYFNFK